jgi:alpha-galactosidase
MQGKRGWLTVLVTFTVALGIGGASAQEKAGEVALSALDLTPVRQGWGKAQANQAVTQKPLSIGGEAFANGVGTHARSVILVQLDGGAKRFRAVCGVDDNAGAGKGSVQFRVGGDGKTLWKSPVMKCGRKGERADVDVSGVKVLVLIASDAGDGTDFDHADWADAKFEVAGAKPRIVSAPEEEAVILTPPAPAGPRINGPKVYGVRPGNPFLYRIPTTGERPIAFSADSLPQGLQLDPAAGIITGVNPPRGEYAVTLRAKNAKGAASKAFKIVSGDTLSLTPSMGWNHWYAHYDRITDKMMREAADVLVASGMADVGYQYVNIDDCWMNAPANNDPLRVGPLRDEKGNLVPNKHFPDMKALADYIHAKGLKAGLYTSPGPLTCGGFAGAYEHEAQDARLFADWGFDFLKYDWCSYSKVVGGKKDIDLLKKPYILMGKLLRDQKRDMLLNLCQYGMGDVWQWGEEVGGQSWRTGGDLGFELNRIFEVALKNVGIGEHNKPGSWNDPDYIQIGFIGTARGMGLPRPCGMSPSEQYAFMSLWCLMAAPLFYSGDMSKLDPFTINILCNPEVIEIDQDPLGLCARLAASGEDTFALVKEMDDGSRAVGLCNRGEWETEVVAKWPDLKIEGRQKARDPWRQKDLGVFENEYRAQVPRHGVVLIRLWPEK